MTDTLIGSGVALLLSAILALTYEIAALISGGKLPTITSLVQDWIPAHRVWTGIIAFIWLGGQIVLLIHFLL